MKIFTQRLGLIVIFMMGVLNGFSQNLLPNGSFELHTSCPDYWSIFPNDQITTAVGWYDANGTCDYYHICGTDEANIPNTFKGYQETHDMLDSAYAGFYPFHDGPPPAAREYLRTTFEPLEVGLSYTFSMKVNAADLSPLHIDCFEVLFYIEYIENGPTIAFIDNAQLDFSSYGIISDSINWVTLETNFIADSAYTNLMIGCFEEVEEVVFESTGIGAAWSSYYYLDDLCLRLETSSCQTITTGNSEVVSTLDEELYFFPNPTNSLTTIVLPKNEPAKIFIYDLQGRLERELQANTQEVQIELPVEQGVYFIQVVGESYSSSVKVVKE